MFGVVGDGVADDTAAIQSAIDSAAKRITSLYPATLSFPPGTFLITKTLTITTTMGFEMFGSGSSTNFTWGGAAVGPMFSFVGCFKPHFHHFQVTIKAAKPISHVFEVSANGVETSQQFLLEDCVVTSDKDATRFVFRAFGQDINNDFAMFNRVQFLGFRDAGWWVQGTVAYNYSLLDSGAQANGSTGNYGYVCSSNQGGPISSATWASGILTVVTTNAHNLAAGNPVSIWSVNPAAFNIVNAQECAVVDNVTFTIPMSGSPGTYSDGGFVTAYGQASNVDIRGGSFSTNWADLLVDGFSAGPYVLAEQNCSSNGYRIFAINGSVRIIRDCDSRWTRPNPRSSTGFPTSDIYHIEGGILSIENNIYQVNDQDATINFQRFTDFNSSLSLLNLIIGTTNVALVHLLTGTPFASLGAYVRNSGFAYDLSSTSGGTNSAARGLYLSTYSDGSVDVTTGSTTVVGEGTTFTTDMNLGVITVNGVPWPIDTITDDTHLELTYPYELSTAMGVAYELAYDSVGNGVISGGGGGGGGGVIPGASVGILQEVPSGTIDGNNAVFTISETPAGVLLLSLNGVEQHKGIDFTINANKITYAVAPFPGDWHIVFYGTTKAGDVPPGDSTEVIYNLNGSFAASPNFVYDGQNVTVAGGANTGIIATNFNSQAQSGLPGSAPLAFQLANPQLFSVDGNGAMQCQEFITQFIAFANQGGPGAQSPSSDPPLTVGNVGWAYMYATDSQLWLSINGGTYYPLSAIPPGSDTQVVFNDNNLWGAVADFVYEKNPDNTPGVGRVTAPLFRASSISTNYNYPFQLQNPGLFSVDGNGDLICQELIPAYIALVDQPGDPVGTLQNPGFGYLYSTGTRLMFSPDGWPYQVVALVTGGDTQVVFNKQDATGSIALGASTVFTFDGTNVSAPGFISNASSGPPGSAPMAFQLANPVIFSVDGNGALQCGELIPSYIALKNQPGESPASDPLGTLGNKNYAYLYSTDTQLMLSINGGTYHTLSAVPPGDDTQVVFNDSGLWGASNQFVYDKNALGVHPPLGGPQVAIGQLTAPMFRASSDSVGTNYPFQLQNPGLFNVDGEGNLLCQELIPAYIALVNQAADPPGTAHNTGFGYLYSTQTQLMFSANGGTYYPILTAPPGTDTQVTFNDNNTWGASSFFVFDKNAPGTNVVNGGQQPTGQLTAPTFRASAASFGPSYPFQLQNPSTFSVDGNGAIQCGQLIPSFVCLKNQSGDPTGTGGGLNFAFLYATSTQLYVSFSGTGYHPILVAPPGTDTQVVFNDNNAWGTSANFVYDKAALGSISVGGAHMATGQLTAPTFRASSTSFGPSYPFQLSNPSTFSVDGNGALQCGQLISSYICLKNQSGDPTGTGGGQNYAFLYATSTQLYLSLNGVGYHPIGGVPPPGTDTQVVFNDNNAWGASANFVFNKNAPGTAVVNGGQVAIGQVTAPTFRASATSFGPAYPFQLSNASTFSVDGNGAVQCGQLIPSYICLKNQLGDPTGTGGGGNYAFLYATSTQLYLSLNGMGYNPIGVPPVPGLNTQVVYNNNNAWGASANFTYNGTSVSSINFTSTASSGAPGSAPLAFQLSSPSIFSVDGNGAVQCGELIPSYIALKNQTGDPTGTGGGKNFAFLYATSTALYLSLDGAGYHAIGAGSAAGTNTMVQYNNNGAFGASAGLTWDGALHISGSGTGYYLTDRVTANYSCLYRSSDITRLWDSTGVGDVLTYNTAGLVTVTNALTAGGTNFTVTSLGMVTCPGVRSTLGSGAAGTESYGQFRAYYGGYGFFIRNDGTTTYFMITNNGDPFGIWKAPFPMQIDNASGNVSMGGNLAVTGAFSTGSFAVTGGLSAGSFTSTAPTGAPGQAPTAFRNNNSSFVVDGNGAVICGELITPYIALKNQPGDPAGTVGNPNFGYLYATSTKLLVSFNGGSYYALAQMNGSDFIIIGPQLIATNSNLAPIKVATWTSGTIGYGMGVANNQLTFAAYQDMRQGVGVPQMTLSSAGGLVVAGSIGCASFSATGSVQAGTYYTNTADATGSNTGVSNNGGAIVFMSSDDRYVATMYINHGIITYFQFTGNPNYPNLP
jgi:hypothetical protein